MAVYEIVCWRDIPALVEAREGGESLTRQLSERWQALIDSLAMQLGHADADDYLAAWTRSAPAERAGSAAEVAEAVAGELEARFAEFAARAFRRP